MPFRSQFTDILYNAVENVEFVVFLAELFLNAYEISVQLIQHLQLTKDSRRPGDDVCESATQREATIFGAAGC